MKKTIPADKAPAVQQRVHAPRIGASLFMNKSSLAFAALASLAGAVSAQSNVTIYGAMDAAVVRESGGSSAGPTTKIGSGVLNGSRLGFKGSEDLGGGLTAIYLLESGFTLDTGAMGQGGFLFGRQAFVGLAGNFGTVSFGRHYSTIDSTLAATDAFGIGTGGRQNNLVGSTYVPRINNSLYYKTPTMSGFAADLLYGVGEVAGNTSAQRYIGGSVLYAKGPLYAKLAHQNLNNASATGAAKITVLAGTYDFNVVKAHFSWATSKTTDAGVVTRDNNDLMAGISVPLGAGRLMASYIC